MFWRRVGFITIRSDAGHRESGNMAGNPLDRRVAEILAGSHQPNRCFTVTIEEALTDDAERAKAHAILAGGVAEHLADDRKKDGGMGFNVRLDKHFDDSWRGIGHFASHEFAMPGGRAFIEQPKEKRADKRREPRLSGRGTGQSAIGGIFVHRRSKPVLQDGGVQAQFIAKMIINGRDIHARPLDDVPNGCLSVPLLGKDFPGGLKKPMAGVGLGIGERRFHVQRNQTVV